MTERYDVIVIGAGHNGLVCANYLAMAGKRVCVLEQRNVVGGAAVTEEFVTGYRNSTASYVVSLLRPEIIADLELKKYGYETIQCQHSFYPSLEGPSLLMGPDEQQNKEQFAQFSSDDYENYEQFYAIVDKVGEVLGSQWLQIPPKLHGGGVTDLVTSVKLALKAFKLSSDERHRMLQLLIGAPETLIERWFESDKIKAVMAQHCLPANYTSLHQTGSAIAMLHHAVGEVDGKKGAWAYVKGGMGGITQAMLKSALDKGVDVFVNATVSQIVTDGNVVTGVKAVVDGGEKFFNAPIVAANTDPKRTFLKLLGEQHLDSSFSKDISAIRQESASLRMNLALSGVPNFKAMPGDAIMDHHKGTISYIESKEHVEQAYRAARAGEPAFPPMIESCIPSSLDDSLAPEGHHVMSVLAKYMPFDLADGKTWDGEKENVCEKIIDYLSLYISNLREILVGYSCLTPLDLERTFGMTRGDICHGRLELDQLYSMRPHPKAAQYESPVKGLFLCGSGAHPGGGVTGAPGHNAAKSILKRR